VRHHQLHAVHGACGGRVDGENPATRLRALHHGGMGGSFILGASSGSEIGSIPSLAGNLGAPIEAAWGAG